MKCTLKHCPEDSIPVPKAWLERLLEHATRVEEASESMLPTEAPLLMGFISSAKTILNPKK